MPKVTDGNREIFKAKKLKDKLCIYSETEFHALMKHERYRTDRSHQSFSLIVYDVYNLIDKVNTLKNYIDTIYKRIRIIDIIGWLTEGKSLGVLLVNTDLAGAQCIAAEFRENLAMPVTIYCYPYKWNNILQALAGDQKSVAEEPAANGQHHQIVKKIENIFIKKLPPWKRLLDIFISLVILIGFSPLFLLISVYIKVVSPGPVLFKQQRIGLNGKDFVLYKFRTMKTDNDITCHQIYLKELIQSGKPMQKLDIQHDSRIIPGGCLLRTSGLDELPQFINILKGEMSFVGPRPSIPYEVKEYLLWHKSRFDMTPGLTGLWQVSGKNKLTFAQMIRLDIRYGKKMSFLFDMLIILKTIPVIMESIFEKSIHKTNV